MNLNNFFLDMFNNLLKINGTPIGVPFTLHLNKKFINVMMLYQQTYYQNII